MRVFKLKIALALLLLATLGMLVALPQIVMAHEHSQGSNDNQDCDNAHQDHESNDTHESSDSQGACQQDQHEETEISFHIQLNGAQQVQPTVTTEAFGFANVRLSDDNQTLEFRIVVCDIANVTQAHIHFGAAGNNGPIILWLFNGTKSGLFTPQEECATLSHGELSPSDLKASSANGINSWTDFINALLAGNTYVNVHTTAHPMGEIRGQLVTEHEQADEQDDD